MRSGDLTALMKITLGHAAVFAKEALFSERACSAEEKLDVSPGDSGIEGVVAGGKELVVETDPGESFFLDPFSADDEILFSV